MTQRIISLLVLVLSSSSACIDYGVNDRLNGNANGDGTDDDALVDGWAHTGMQLDNEWCNGKDDDGDGLIDEGFPDLDGDGVKDCLDDDCDVRTADPFAVRIGNECEGEVPIVLDPWSIGIEWEWRGIPGNLRMAEVTTTPLVGNLDDDNGDGIVDHHDIPEVVVIAFDSADSSDPQRDAELGHLVVIDGRDGSTLWTKSGYTGFSGTAMADITGDGVTDIVAFSSERYPEAIDANGTRIWRAKNKASTIYPQATVADLDADGEVEVIADRYVLDGKTGAVEAHLSISSAILGRMPAVGDLDLDGVQEIILGNRVFAPDGTVLWEVPLIGEMGHWSAIINADSDPEAEVVMIGGGQMVVLEHDGTEIRRVNVGARNAGPPCAGDFDGDGQAEVGWASDSIFYLYELDGTLMWAQGIDDPSGLAGCSGFDFNADGAIEVVYADQFTLHIFDGPTGNLMWSRAGHASGTIWEYPSIADIDGDGSAELLLASNNRWGVPGWAGVTAFGQIKDEWPASGSTWHVHDFAVTNITHDGVVPAIPNPPWQAHNVYRARPAVEGGGFDFQVAFLDVCFTGCNPDVSVAEVSIVGLNTGPYPSPGPVAVSLYADYNGLYDLIETQWIAKGIEAGWTSEALVFTVPVDRVGTHGFMVRIDDDGRGNSLHEECSEDNNETTYDDIPACLRQEDTAAR